MDFPTTKKAVKDLAKRWPEAKRHLIEDKANGPAVISALKRELSGLIPVSVKGSKEARAHAVSATVQSGNVFLPIGAPWLSEYVNELADFPNGSNDDQVDATTQALDSKVSSKASASSAHNVTLPS